MCAYRGDETLDGTWMPADCQGPQEEIDALYRKELTGRLHRMEQRRMAELLLVVGTDEHDWAQAQVYATLAGHPLVEERRLRRSAGC
ncbi:hypothetical protein [Actinomadura macra]|uniref:hypothetical protein n=1 Tax=Actinomadura macra TaxID=46164 RepID=UPI0012FAD9E7|nr:hypothetical protein [Actinomadura macra]